MTTTEKMIEWLDEQGACLPAIVFINRQIKKGRSPAQVWWAIARAKPQWCGWLLRHLDIEFGRQCQCGSKCTFVYDGWNDLPRGAAALDHPWSKVSEKWKGVLR